MSQRISRNGNPSHQHQSETLEYVKNEVDLKLDRLSELWTKLERKLLTKEPPRRICILYYTSVAESCEDGSELTERRFLGIQRHGGKWRICSATAVGLHPRGEEFPWKPIPPECDAPACADAVTGIEEPKREVRKTRSLFIPKLDKAISSLEDSLDDMLDNTDD